MSSARDGRLVIDVGVRASPVMSGGDRNEHCPRNTEIGVMALVPDTWGPQWQVRQHMLTRLADHFHVVWMNPARHWRELFAPRVPLRTDEEPEALPVGFDVYTPPPWLAQWHRFSWLSRWSLREQLRHARARLVARGAKRIVLYLWRPEFADALDLVPHDMSCYHIDDEYSFSLTEVETSPDERRLIERVDQVFIHSPGLMEKKGWINPRTDFVPLGADFERFSAPAPEPEDLRSIPRPRFGYVGVLKKTLDWPLLDYLSRRHPAWNFVLLGPRAPHGEIQGPIEELGRRDNVHFLPGRPTKELAAYPQHFDAGIMPYALNDYARYGYPLKCHEFLAGGRPVVGCRMRTLEDLEEVVLLAETREEWEERLAQALTLEEQGFERTAARQDMARRHDWRHLVGKVAYRLLTRHPDGVDDISGAHRGVAVPG